MPDARERLVIEAVIEDAASGSLRRVNRELDVSSKGAARAESAWTKLGRSLGRYAGAAGVLGASVALRRVSADALRAASAAEEVDSKFRVVFGDSAGSTARNLAVFADLTGRATTELKSYAASIQDTLVPLGLSRREASLLSTEIAKLAVDLGSFNDKAEADVIRDLQSALVGQTETVRKYGVVINAAAVEQEALRAGLADSKKEITEADKVLARLNLILAGTKDAQGDAERTADSLANSMRRLRADLLRVDEVLGQKLAESLDTTTGKVDVLTAAIGGAKGLAAGAASGLLGAASQVLGLFGDTSDFKAEDFALAGEAIGRAFTGLPDPRKVGRLAEELKALVAARSEANAQEERLANSPFKDIQLDAAFLQKVADRDRARELLSLGLFGLPLAQFSTEAVKLREEGQRRIQLEQQKLAEAVQRDSLRRLQADLISSFQIEERRLLGDEVGAEQAQIRKDFDFFLDDLRKQRGEFELIDDEAAKAFAAIEKYARKVREIKLAQVVEDAKEQTEELVQEVEEVQASLAERDFARGLSGAFTDIAFGIRDADDALRDFATNFLRLVAQRAFQDFLLGGATGGFFGLTGAATGGVFGGLGTLTPFANGGIPGGGLGPMQKLATGGVISPGPHLAMVNEGPFREAVLPLKRQSDGTLGVGAEGGGGGGGGMSVVINAVDSQSFLSLASRDPEGLASVILAAAQSSPAVRSGFGLGGVVQ